MSLDTFKRLIVRHPRLLVMVGLVALLLFVGVDPVGAVGPPGPSMDGVYVGP